MIFYNAHHAPIGAFASFTIGQKGSKGGLGLELAGPANEAIYIGVENREGGSFSALPFFDGGGSDRAVDFDVEGLSEFSRPSAVTWFPDEQIQRTMNATVDEWRAGDLTFRVLSPVSPVPDPEMVTAAELQSVVCPSILAEITVDNRGHDLPRRAFFGYLGSDRAAGMRVIHEPGLVGIAQHTVTGIATDDLSVRAGIAFQPEKILAPDSQENLEFLVGNLGLLVCEVPAGEIKTVRFAIGFFREGTATTGIRTRYLYRRYFNDLEEVLSHTLTRFEALKREATSLADRFGSELSTERAWMAAQSIRSYYGSTQLLEREDGRPLWVVNEGEYRMMNTFDLTVDQAFFELALNPWTVRNVLDLYVERYAYTDEARLPGAPEKYPGGLAFTHDMGVGNAFSRAGFSGYEQSHLKGCFSYMSVEELMNWVITASLYDASSHDVEWTVSHRETFAQALHSLVNRDHPDNDLRNGIVSLDGARCEGGAEITTYDSLDASLGQARNNLYLAVKGWASYVLLENVLRRMDDSELADQAKLQSQRVAQTIVAAAGPDGVLPAVFNEGIEARIIPAIEAMVYPFCLGIEVDPALKSTLARHLNAVLKPGVCKFQNGGWKLSSTSLNTWLSKIYLCQYVAEQVLDLSPDEQADRVHMSWLLDPENSYFAWSDQIVDGKAIGSRYYPRGVTSVLWTALGENPLSKLRENLLGGAVAV